MGRHCKQGINDIRTKRPDIATYMDNYNTYHKITNKNIPEQISYSGKDHIYLRCEHGHDFDGIANKINQRKRDENGIIYCPECHKLGIRKIPYIPRKTFRQSLYDYCIENNKQYLLDEWNEEENKKLGVDIKNIGKGSNKPKVWWTCPLGHTYDMSVSDRTEGGNCPYCSGTRLLVGFNDLLSQYPEVCKDWDYTKNKKKPEECFQHSPDKAHWKCHKCGHEWEAAIGKRTSKTNPSGCPNCINHGMSRIDMCIFLSIQQYYPDAKYREKIDGIEFDTFVPSANFAIEYDGHFHDENRTGRDAKKDVKAKEKNVTFLRIKETKDISETHLFKDNILYLNVKYNTKYKENCEIILNCLKNNLNINIGTSVPNNIVHIAVAKMGAVNYENSLEAKFPEIAKQLHPTKNHGLTADKIDYSSHIKLWWVCSNCGNEFEKEVHRMTDKRYARAGKCKYCTGQARKKGYNDLETLFPGIIEFWDFSKNEELGLNFYEMSKSSTKYAYWKFPFTKNNYMQIKSAVIRYKEKYL